MEVHDLQEQSEAPVSVERERQPLSDLMLGRDTERLYGAKLRLRLRSRRRLYPRRSLATDLADDKPALVTERPALVTEKVTEVVPRGGHLATLAATGLPGH